MYVRHHLSKYWKVIKFIVIRNAQVTLLSNRDLKSLRLLHQKYPYFLGDIEPSPEDIYTVSEETIPTDGGHSNMSHKDTNTQLSVDTQTPVSVSQSVPTHCVPDTDTHTPNTDGPGTDNVSKSCRQTESEDSHTELPNDS